MPDEPGRETNQTPRPEPRGLAQERVTSIYNRNARLYDIVDAPMEALMFRRWRPLLFWNVQGKVLEVGVGTGRNLPHYPRSSQAESVAVDVAEKMLRRARRRSEQLEIPLDLKLADIQNLPFANEAFDVVVATTVFCSVADPIKGLRELHRVLKPDGQLRLLEHQRPPGRLLAKLFDWLNPLFVMLSGANINRTTDANVALSGFTGVRSKKLGPLGIVRFITAYKPTIPAALDSRERL